MWKRLIKSRVPEPVWFALRETVSELRIARVHRAGCRIARRLSTRAEGVKLNLGSGLHPKPGWINVDLFAPTADARLDLRRPLPFPDGCAAYIYVEHFFEHLNYPQVIDSMGWDLEQPGVASEALRFLRESRRVLAPGGVLDIVVPDTEGMIDEYVQRGRRPASGVDWWGPRWCDTALHRVNYLFRQGREHKYAYDEETISRVLASVGFIGVRRRAFDPAIDAPNHEIGSLCIVAQKPVTESSTTAPRGDAAADRAAHVAASRSGDVTADPLAG